MTTKKWDQQWNKDFDAASAKRKKERTEQDKKMIRKYASHIDVEISNRGVERWYITFLTVYGNNNCIWFVDSGKWKKEGGTAKGKGSKSMLNYFRPIVEFEK